LCKEWLANQPLFSSVPHPLQQLYNDPLIPSTRLTQRFGSLRADIPFLMVVHTAVKFGLERARKDKMVGQSLQSSVVISVPAGSNAAAVLERHSNDLESMFVVSAVHVNGESVADPEWSYTEEFEVHGTKGSVTVLPPTAAKCPRCWRYVAPAEEELCGRCDDIVKALE
jgi:isoleucyl-tRNA synthetase